MAQSDKGVPAGPVVASKLSGVREYKLDEVYDLIEKACELGLDGHLDGNMTIGELDKMLNNPAN